jgi:TadE-like protein
MKANSETQPGNGTEGRTLAGATFDDLAAQVTRPGCAGWLRANRFGCTKTRRGQMGQALAEFALMAAAFMLLILGGLQMALIVNAALAVNEYSYAAARWVAVNGCSSPPCTCNTGLAPSQIEVPPSPTIAGSGLSITSLSCLTASGSTDADLNTGDQIKLGVSYTLGNKIFLPRSFLGFALPTSLTNSTSIMVQ